jgi:spore coat protein U-like protein
MLFVYNNNKKMGNSMKKQIKFLAALALSAVAMSSMAATATGSFPISATIISSCAINTSTGIAFGTYSPTSDLTGTGTIGLLCTSGTAWSVTANAGGGTILARTMASGANTLNFNLYREVGLSSIFGDGTNGVAFTGTGSGATQTLTVYGNIPAGQYNVPGSYASTITVTLTY